MIAANYLLVSILLAASSAVFVESVDLFSWSIGSSRRVTKNWNKNTNVIMAPGFGGSRLEMRLNKNSSVMYFCEKESDWQDMWINLKLLLPYAIDCLIDNMRLDFNPATNMTINPAGVQVRVKNPNNLTSIEYLHDIKLPGSAYFGYITDRLVKELGYNRDLDLRGAPYDFRRAPYELDQYFTDLRHMTEDTGKPVTYICHSMGCTIMLYFLQRQTPSWKAQHVRRLISIAAPWAGSYSALQAAILGHDLGMPYLFDHSKLVRVQSSLPSISFMFPHWKAFHDRPLIRTFLNHKGLQDNTLDQYKSLNLDISARNLDSSLKLINHEIHLMWLNSEHLLQDLKPPGVEVWCLVGSGTQTMIGLDFLGAIYESQTEERYTDGDGTVELISSSYCKNWSNQQDQPVNYREFKASHLGILRNDRVLKTIIDIITESTQQNDTVTSSE